MEQIKGLKDLRRPITITHWRERTADQSALIRCVDDLLSRMAKLYVYGDTYEEKESYDEEEREPANLTEWTSRMRR
jgi:hypothetical protein